MKTAAEILQEELGEKRVGILRDNGLLALVQWAMVKYKEQPTTELGEISCKHDRGTYFYGGKWRCILCDVPLATS